MEKKKKKVTLIPVTEEPFAAKPIKCKMLNAQ